MATIIADDLQICSDCLDAVEFCDHDLGFIPGTLFNQQKKMIAHRPDLELDRNKLVCNESSNYTEFSTSPCDTCGTTMAGARFGYAVLASNMFGLDDCVNYESNTLGDCGGRVEVVNGQIVCETCRNRKTTSVPACGNPGPDCKLHNGRCD